MAGKKQAVGNGPSLFTKNEYAKLLPFGISIVIYFYNFIPENTPSMFAMVLKCLPILSLALFVYLLGLENPLRKNIFRGLLLSCIGDAFLLWEEKTFAYGIFAFGLAQIHFITAHGLTPRRYDVLGVVLLACVPIVVLILPGIISKPIIIQIASTCYTPLLLGTLWRSVVRSKTAKKDKDENILWTLQCASFGGILFFISDSILSISIFYKQIPYHQLFVMVTYYGSQLMTSLSAFKEHPQMKVARKNNKL